MALQAIDKVETTLRDCLKPRTVRCRLRFEGLIIELDEETLNALSDAVKDGLATEVKETFTHDGVVSGVRPRFCLPEGDPSMNEAELPPDFARRELIGFDQAILCAGTNGAEDG